MLSPVPNAPKKLLGASIPRSGHHFLQHMLSLYFGADLFYCEFYSQPNCCKNVPCTRGIGHSVVYQKSHDRDFTLNPDIGDALYVVQFRHPVPEALSDRELDLRDEIGRKSLEYRLTKAYYAWWLAAKAIYYRHFHKKWFEHRVSNGVYLDYAELSRNPLACILPIIEWAAGSVDNNRLEQIVSEASPSRVSSPDRKAATFIPRVIESSPHFDRNLLGAFESYVLQHCAGYNFERELAGSYEGHPLYGLILAQDPEEPLPAGETDRLTAAAKRAAGHPEIALRLAKRELDNGFPQRAVGTLDEAISNTPSFGPGYRLLAQACKTAGTGLPASALTNHALFACTDNTNSMVEVAAAMLAEKKIVHAIGLLSTATVLDPENYRANHLLAKILASQGRWAQASTYAQAAAKLKPNNRQNTQLLAGIAQRTTVRKKVKV